jgi:hypothetical protein
MRDQPTTRHVLAAAVALVWIASVSPVSAQGHLPVRDSSVTFPGTPIGRLGQTLIEVINGGDGHGGGGPGSGISSELGWFQDNSYVAIVLGNYDLPGASAIYQKLVGLLVAQ